MADNVLTSLIRVEGESIVRQWELPEGKETGQIVEVLVENMVKRARVICTNAMFLSQSEPAEPESPKIIGGIGPRVTRNMEANGFADHLLPGDEFAFDGLVGEILSLDTLHGELVMITNEGHEVNLNMLPDGSFERKGA